MIPGPTRGGSSSRGRSAPTSPGTVLALVFPLLLLVAACTAGNDAPPPPTEDLLPGGYEVVTDTGRSDPGHFQVSRDEDFLDVMTGPGGIAWRPADSVAAGDFLAEATMTVIGAPLGYREGYGVFVGGRSLEAPGTRYTYLLVRPAGDYMVAQHGPAGVDTLVAWTHHNAVQPVTDERPEPTNVVGIMALGDEVRFLVNGTVVHTMPLDALRPYGLAGLRISHRVEVHVPAWYLGAPPLETGS